MSLTKDFKDETYIFIDISNIYIGFYNHIMYNYKKYNICNPKMDYINLFIILENEKNIKKRILIGSENKKKYKKEKKYQKKINDLGYEVHFLERVNNKEQGVDDLLHDKIIETLLFEIPGTIIIASGDGKNGDLTNNSFYNLCIQALQKGWKVIIVSWKKQLSKRYTLGPELCNLLKESEIKNNFEILYLDDHIEKLIC